MRVFKNLFGDGSKIHGDEIVVGDSNNHVAITELIKTVAYSQSATIVADLNNNITFYPTLPDGYELLGYIASGIYTDSTKSSFYQGIMNSITLSEDNRAVVSAYSIRAANVNAHVEIVGIYKKLP